MYKTNLIESKKETSDFLPDGYEPMPQYGTGSECPQFPEETCDFLPEDYAAMVQANLAAEFPQCMAETDAFIPDNYEPIPQADNDAACQWFIGEMVDFISGYRVLPSYINTDAEFQRFMEDIMELLKDMFTNRTIGCCTDFIYEVLPKFFLTYTDGSKEKAYELMTIFYTCLCFINDVSESIEYNE